MDLNFKPNEVVLKASDSNCILGKESINGKLIVTNQRIYFMSGKNSADFKVLEILPSEIKEVIYFNTKLVLPNGLNLITKLGTSHSFILRRRSEFGGLINKMY